MPSLPKFPPVPGLSGPPPTPVLGRLGNVTRLVREPIRFLGELHGRYGRIAAVTRNDPAMVSALGPEFNQQILSDAKLFSTLEDGGIDASDKVPEDSALSDLVKDPAQERRLQLLKMVLPTLHANALPAYVDAMVASADRVLGEWKVGQQVDVARDLRRIAFRTAMSVLIGLEPDAHHGEALGAAYQAWIRLVYLNSMAYLSLPLPGPRMVRMMLVSRRLMEKARQAVLYKRQHPGPDALSRLIQTEDPEAGRMSEEELVFSAHTLLVFGHQSVPNVLSFALFCLSQHPAVLAEVREEVDTVLQGAPPTYAKLAELKRLQAVIQETLRLFPPNVFQRRIAQARFGLGPFELPRGTSVFWNTYYTHRLPALYANPNRFEPRRWETLRPKPFEYLPFGYGPHGCIGAQFAQAELKIVLSLLLQRFQLTLAPGAEVDYAVDATLRPTSLRMAVLDRRATFERHLPKGRIQELIELV